ncbi:MAG: hypothetical protein CL862_02850 [Cyanobium sp. NAT70]|jgi:subtilisin-like proprotein convertase family protein|nr:hypothetical protein [Cyanobium sp. NAT70]|tara:strand:+ start:7354 stop:10644 length:3291 start_codon:yes stop_codon:yes gene_type:complete
MKTFISRNDNNKDRNTHQLATSRFKRWQDQLSQPIQQSIDFFSDPRNLSKQEVGSVSRWVVAGVSQENIEQFQKIATRTGIKNDGTKLNTEGFGIDGLELTSLRPGSASAFHQLKQHANKLGLEFWQEVKQEITTMGEIDPLTITEGTFDLNLGDEATATDVNGDGIPDPMFHLLASDAANASYGVNAVGGWSEASGEGVRVGIVDSPHDLLHTDLNGNLPVNFDLDGDGILEVDADGNGIPDILDNDHSAGSIASHGTAVSGIALARHNNGSAVGVAPESTYVPHHLVFGGSMPDSGYYNYTDVVNNSWGWDGTSGVLQTRTPLFLASWETATQNSIQVVAAGNERDPGNTGTQGWDNTNNDGWTRRDNIIVGATMRNGEVEQYSTPGASLFVSAPVNGSNFRFINSFGVNSNQQRTTTSDVTDDPANNFDDVGYANGTVTTRMNGTSAAAPMVTGSIAMMLEANPSLTVRDVQHILTETSIKNGLFDSNGDGQLDAVNPNAGGDAAVPGSAGSIELRTTFQAGVNTTFGIADGHNTGWFQNGAGHWVSDSFGFGIVDAGAAANAASTWTNVSDELKATTNTILSNPYTIPEGNLGGLNSLSDAGSWNVNDTLKVEWVELTLDLNLPEQDEVMLAVQSPSGTRSVLMAPGGNDATGFNGERTLITNQFWGENSDGEWSIEVLDTNNDGDSATISNAYLDIYGTCDKESPLKVTPFSKLQSNGFSLQSLAKKFLADGGANNGSYKLLSVNPYGDKDSFGTFTQGVASGLKIDQGTIFTTGKAEDAIGPNSAPNTTTNWNNPGISLLGANSKDLSGMEIRFIPKQNMVLDWKAQFGSEEFDEWSPSIFDDKAAIFFGRVRRRNARLEHLRPSNLLEGPSGTGFSVNGFSKNQSMFKEHIQMNEPCGPLTWEYDGTSRNAWNSKKAFLQKGKVYTIAPMIADAQDHIYDSGVIFGPNKTIIRPIDKFIRPIQVKPIGIDTKPEGIDRITGDIDFKQLGTSETKRFAWAKLDPAKLSDGQIDSIRWDDVDLKRSSGKRAFDYKRADWNAIINSDGFGDQAAKSLRTDLLPDHSLSDESLEKLMGMGVNMNAGKMDLLTM